MKVTVHDHLIVGASGHTSMRAMGLIQSLHSAHCRH